MPHTITNKFIFPANSRSPAGLQQQILGFITNNLPGHADAGRIHFKAKVIIAELLNNALKHAGGAETIIYVFIDDEHIKIEKTDFGNRFNPNNLISSAAKPATKVQLSKDALHQLYALIGDETFIKFICAENNNDHSPHINDIDEHFGLLIITKSSDEFTYRYDPASGQNMFTMRLKLR